MTYEDLRAFFLTTLQASNHDHSGFRSTLALLGYDPKNLLPTRARRYNLSFHSRAIEGGGDPLEVLAKVALDTKVDGDATRMLCMERGEVVEGGDGYRVQELREGVERWSYAAENTSADKVVTVEIEFAGEYSANVAGSKKEQGIS